jgi:hypothetical protein
MIVHLVLFRPKTDLDTANREALVAAIERARRDIPSIRRFVVGARILHSTNYAAVMEDFPLAAVLEFDDRAGVEAYLGHPAHADLSRVFWMTGEKALAYDFDCHDAAAVRSLIAP